MIMQDPRYALNPVRNLYQQIEESLLRHQTLNKSDRRDRVLKWPVPPGYQNRRSPLSGQLSGGMGQRAMVAIALINNPSVLIADRADLRPGCCGCATRFWN